MAQGILPFKYEEEKKDTGLTGLAGLPVYLDLATVMGLSEIIERHLHIKQQGWTDSQTLTPYGNDCLHGHAGSVQNCPSFGACAGLL